MSDAMDELAGLAAGSPLYELRRQRPDVVKYMQASDDAILRPKDSAGFPHAERAQVAERIATVIGDQRLAAHYRSMTGVKPATLDPKLKAAVTHAERLTRDPDAAQPEHLTALADAGLSPQAIVALSQVIAYVNYQARVLAGLRTLGATP